MSVSLPEQGKRVIDAPNYATVATLEPDGTPQLSVVWIARDGDELLFSTTKARRKVANLLRDPRITLLVYPLDSPYTYLEVRGAAELAADDGRGLIDELARKYTGRGSAGRDAPGVERVVVRIRPAKVVWRG